MLWERQAYLLFVVVVQQLNGPAYMDVYTSIASVKKMLRSERNLLAELKNNLPSDLTKQKDFLEFYQRKRKEIDGRNMTEMQQRLDHPNEVYHVIKYFAWTYGSLRKLVAAERLPPHQFGHLFSVADRADLDGSMLALLRLQDIYDLKTRDMIAGDYSHFLGPLLTSEDAFLLGAAAFQYPEEEELKKLGDELDKDVQQTDTTSDNPLWDHFRTCARGNGPAKKPLGRGHRCRFRGAIPYYRYREEVMSESPYISIIYDVISDKESRTVRGLSLSQMSRGEVVTGTGVQSSYTRTCQVAFLADNSSSTVLRLSRRIGYITGLDTTVSPQGFLSPSQSSSEPLQLVNYGIGGFFGLHRDPLEYRNHITERVLTHSGNRMASFLIYLSPVHLGGHTIFLDLDLALYPIKNSALFWYNYSPSGLLEEHTWHQGCPVVVGDKWIANKWILSHGNTFVRRCGLRQEATQDDIEADMLRRYRY